MPTFPVLTAAMQACFPVTLEGAEEPPARRMSDELLPDFQQLSKPFVFGNGSAVRRKENWTGGS